MLKPRDGITIDLSEQGSPDWLKARVGLPTASKAGAIMMRQRNGQPYATRKNYITELALERTTGQPTEFTQSEAMRNGTEMERTAALAYEFATGNETQQTGFWHSDSYGASPDDLIVGQNGGVEYKNPLASTHYQTLQDGIIPEYYYWQIIQCMYVTGAEFWDYVSHCADFPPNAQLFIKRVNASEGKVKEDLELLHKELIQVNKEVEEQVNYIKNYKGEL